ncbi:MAG TPA: class I SAM-dependent methyltransferase [Pseudomonadales bacterium]|nr:class I SAM-dependent methyltransferase [Pseudomonadales bacterium]
MSLYDRYVLSPMIDRMCGTREVMAVRSEVVPEAHGDVLELGLGSGLNLGLYDPQRVRRVVGVDPGEHITALARRRMEAAPFEVELLGLSGEAVPADDHSFDSAVVTFTFCTIPNVYAALAEVRRLLKPGGRLLFAEHGLAPDAATRRWQYRINPLWKALAGGCHITRDTSRLLEDGGFRLLSGVHGSHAMEGPRIATWVTRGAAVVR